MSHSSISMPPKLPPKKASLKEQVKVIFPYKAAHEDELSLNDGDIITIISKDIEDQGWWKGELNGKVGVFPENYVIPIRLVGGGLSATSSSSIGSNTSTETTTTSALNSSAPPEESKMVSRKSPSESKLNKVISMLSKSNSMDTKTSGPNRNEEESGTMNGTNPDAEAVVTTNVIANSFLNRKTAKPFPGSKPLSKSESAHHLNYSSRDEEHKDSTTTAELNNTENQPVKLTHLTASRVRGPRDRRPPSMIQLSRDDDDSNMLNLSSMSMSNDKLDSRSCDSSSHMLMMDSSESDANNSALNSNLSSNGRLHSRSNSISEHGKTGSSTASVPPWMVELKKTQEKKNEIRKKSFNTSDDGNSSTINCSNTNSLPNKSTLTSPSSPTKLTNSSYRMSADFGPRFGKTESNSLSRHNSVNNGTAASGVGGSSFLQARAPSSDSLEAKESSTNASNGGGHTAAVITSPVQSAQLHPPPITGSKPVKAAKPISTKLIQSSVTSLNNGTTATVNNNNQNAIISGKELVELQKELKSLKEECVSRKEYEALLKKVNELSDLLENQKHSYRTLIKDIINDLAEEKKKVANLHIEVDRLRKITSTV